MVTVTDNSGCSGTDMIFLEETENPMPSITGAESICSGSFSTLEVEQFPIIEWSVDENSSLIEIFSGGIYTVTVTDNNGCTGTDEVLVESFQPPQPEIIGNPGLCEGLSSFLEVGVFEQYMWSNGETSQIIEVTSPGLYEILVTDANGCTGTDELQVTAFENPDLVISGTTSFCVGGSTILSVSQFESIAWSTGEEDVSISVVEEGNYIITVTNADGCIGIDSVFVSESESLVPGITGDTIMCSGDQITLTAGLFDQYAWSTGQSNQEVLVSEGGTYSVTVTDAEGCSGTEAITVQEISPPDPPIFGEFVICQGDTINLSTEQYSSIQWSNGDTTQTIPVFEGGNYSVTVVDAEGCSGTSTIELESFELPVPIISGDPIFCTGGSTVLEVADFNSYLWSNDSTGNQIVVDESGIYTVTVTDAGACTGEAAIEVLESELLMPQISGGLSICNDGNTVLSADSFDSYLWSTGSSDSVITITEPDQYSLTVTDLNGCTGVAFVDVSENENLIPIINGALEICTDESSILSVGNFESYLWSTGSDIPEIIVTESGQYSITVTDGSGCTGEAMVEVIVSENILPVIVGQLEICSGSSSILSVGEFESYLWSTGSDASEIEINAAGQYSVTVTDASGCTGDAIVEVTESESLMPEITGQLEICAGSSSILSVGNFESYLWSTGSDTSEIEISEAGQYSVTVTDASGCKGEATVEVTESESLTPEITGQLEICTGSSSILSTGNFESYIWSTGSDTSEIEITAAGQYSVTVTDGSGCTGEATVEVTESESLTPEITGQLEICTGSSSILSVGDFESYIWSTGSDTSEIEITAAGQYSVTVTDGSGCTGETSAEIIESESLMPEIMGQLEICTGSSTILSVGDFENYIWSTGSNTSEIVVSESGQYGVTVTDGSGCTGETSAEIIESESLMPSISGSTLICLGESTNLSVGNFDTYQWSTGADAQQIEVSEPGNYSVSVSDQDGCTGFASIRIDTLPGFVVDAGENVVVTSEKPVQLQASEAASYEWSHSGELSCNDCFNPIATPTQTTTYYVTGIDENGCKAIDSVTVFVVIDLDLDPVNTITPNGDGLNDAFVVRGLDPFENAKLTVFNRWGDVIYNTPSYQNDWKGTYNGKPVPAGTYLYILKVQVFDQVAELKGTLTIIRE
jgi:gliding motility-associated-like protein